MVQDTGKQAIGNRCEFLELRVADMEAHIVTVELDCGGSSNKTLIDGRGSTGDLPFKLSLVDPRQVLLALLILS